MLDTSCFTLDDSRYLALGTRMSSRPEKDTQQYRLWWQFRSTLASNLPSGLTTPLIPWELGSVITHTKGLRAAGLVWECGDNTETPPPTWINHCDLSYPRPIYRCFPHIQTSMSRIHFILHTNNPVLHYFKISSFSNKIDGSHSYIWELQ